MKTMIQAAAVTLFAASAAHAQQAVQWRVQDGGNGHWYQYVPTRVTWHQASAACLSRGGQLVTLGSAAENAFVNGIVASRYLAGGFQPSAACEPGCDWQWSSGEPWIYTNWNPGEPNDMGGEDFLLVNPGFPGWNDITTESIEYVIEWSADCNGDGIVDYGQCRDGTLPDYNGNNIPDCCESGAPCVVGNYPVQWRVEDGGNGHWYQVRAKVGDWFACRTAARDLNGDLASPSTALENSFVERLVPPKQFPIWNRVFLGGRQNDGSAPNDGWYWVDGSAWTYVDWFDNQPNGGEGFLVTMPDESGCTWGDYPANSSDIYYFMVEWSADCNIDGVVDYGQILRSQLPDANANGVPDLCDCTFNPALPACCTENLNGDSVVDGADLGILLFAWGPAGAGVPADLNSDGQVDGADLGLLLAGWGDCT